MKQTSLYNRVGFAAAVAAIVSVSGIAQAETFRAQTNVPGSGTYLATVAMSNVVSTHTDHNFEVSASVVSSKSMVALARGDIDFSPVVLTLIPFMQNAKGPYAKLPNAAELGNNLRLMFTHPSGTYHLLTFPDSGIETMQDLKGKRIFAGPKKSAMLRTAMLMIDIETGYKPGEDFELLDLDMKGGEQAFLDGHVDVWIRPAPLGGAMIEQVGVTKGVRFLGFTEKGVNNETTTKYLRAAGRGMDQIMPGTYSGQVNTDPVETFGFWMGVGARKDMDADTVYAMTKAVWDNIDEFKTTAKSLFGPMSHESMIKHIRTPLHLGSYRFYKDMGLEIPEALIPPEAAE